MNETILENQSLKNKKTIVILSLVSLICTALSCIEYFVVYYKDMYMTYYKPSIEFPGLFSLLCLLTTLAPCILMVLYILKFHGNFKVTAFLLNKMAVPTIFILIAISHIFCIFYGIYYEYYSSIDITSDLAVAVAFALVAHSASKGFPRKISLVIASVGGSLISFMSLFTILQDIGGYLEDKVYLYIFTGITGIVGAITLYTALLLFGLSNKPLITSASPEHENNNTEEMDPAQALRILKDKFELGMITEEEYRVQRGEILSKL